MCGLIGRIRFQGAADALFLGPLQQRGLDASGAWLSGDGRCWLEHLEQSGWIYPAWIQHQWAAFEAGQLSWPRAWCLVVLGEFAQHSSQA